MPNFAAPSFRPSRTIVITSRSQFDSAWSGLRPGDYLDVRGVTFTGEMTFAKSLSSPAEVHFDSNVRFTGAASGSQLPAVWLHDSSNVRFFGGDITGAGNQGIRFDGDANVLWWDYTIHDTAGSGMYIHGANDHLDLRGTITHCGLDLSLDPHVEKGTGNHAVNIGSDSGSDVSATNSRFEFWVHDQPYGAAVELQGVQNSQLYLDARRITFQAKVQTGGNALQIWGGDTRGLDVPYLYGDTLAGQAVYVNGLDSSDGAITVEYARATNVRLSPVYMPSSAIDYEDVG